MSGRRLRTWLSSGRGRRYVRYSLVSLISVVSAQAVLAAAFGIAEWSARFSNFLAFLVGTAVSFWLNRHWTWEETGRARVMGQIAPFWLLAIATLALATWAVGAVEAATERWTDRTIRTLLVMAASLTVTGVVWIVKFLILDRLLFNSARIPVVESKEARR